MSVNSVHQNIESLKGWLKQVKGDKDKGKKKGKHKTKK